MKNSRSFEIKRQMHLIDGSFPLTRRDGNTVEGVFVPTPLTEEHRSSGTSEVRRKQKRSAFESWKLNREWEQEPESGQVPEIDYETDILEDLRRAKIREIADATGLSMSYAAAIRNGHEVCPTGGTGGRSWSSPNRFESARSGSER